MHQHPRPPPRAAASANPTQSNSLRSSNPPTRASSSQDVASASQATRTESDRSQSTVDRLALIILHFFTKTALVICASRVTLPPAITKNGDAKIDRWFNTLVEESDALNQDLQGWKSMDATVERPPPLVIDVFLDTAQLAQNQTLVALDEAGRPWDVSDTLQKLSPQSQAPSRLVYERWTISLDDASSVPQAQLNDAAPNFYKKGIITCRALCTYARLLPAWRLGRRLGRQAANGTQTLRPRYRISDTSLSAKSQPDTLSCPLFPSDKRPTETHRFAPVHCSYGSLNISVTYRKNLDVHVELSERLISARMATHERPSFDRPLSRLSRESSRERASLEQDRESLRGQTSRFSSSFKRPALPSNPPGSSPRSSSFREGSERAYSRQVSGDQEAWGPPQDQGGLQGASQEVRRTPSLIQREREGSRFAPSSHKETGAVPFQRRPSVSFQPFKAGSLSSSPAAGNYFPGSPSGSISRMASNPLIHNRKSSLTTLPQQALRAPGVSNETAVASSASSSPKPAPIQRYSSSFRDRKHRFPSMSNSRVDEDNTSSGRASVSSGNRGSSTLPEAEVASSGSVQGDEENIADFLKLLDKNKGLSSFNKTDKASLSANSQRTAAQYSKFSRMKDSTAQLSDSMASSLMLHRSSSSSSRGLPNVPGMIPGSLSTSSSPGKAISPHTPHMPAVPSRLSNNSIVADYSRDRSRSRISDMRGPATGNDGAPSRVESNTGGHGTPLSTAIDIPTSPRTFPVQRRSSSVAQKARARGSDLDDTEAYGLRSASVPAEDRGELSLSELLMQTESGGSIRRRREAAAAADDDEPLLFALAD